MPSLEQEYINEISLRHATTAELMEVIRMKVCEDWTAMSKPLAYQAWEELHRRLESEGAS